MRECPGWRWGRAPGRRRGGRHHRLRARRHQPRRHLVQRARRCAREDVQTEKTKGRLQRVLVRDLRYRNEQRAACRRRRFRYNSSAVVASPPCRPKFAESHARGSDARALERDDDRDRDGHRATAGCGGASSFGTFPRLVATRVAFRDAARLLGCRIFLGRPAGRAPSRGHRRRRHRRPRRLRRASSRWRRRARLRARHRAPLERGHGHRALAERAQGAPVRRPGRGARGGVARPRHLRHAHGRRGRHPTPKPARVSPSSSRPNSATPPSPSPAPRSPE